MSDPQPPPIPGTLRSALVPGERLVPTLAAAAGVILLGDFLFWDYRPGLSFGLFVLAVVGLLLAKNHGSAAAARVMLPSGLVAAAAVQTAVGGSFSNIAVIMALIAVLMGELYFQALPVGWARWSESLVAWTGALGRWIWLAQAANELSARSGGAAAGLGARISRILRIGFPAALLLVIFVTIFSAGNRIFGDLVERFGSRFWEWLRVFDFSIPRLLFWGFLGTLGLTLVRPRSGPSHPRAWARAPGDWKRAVPAEAFWQSALILVALNAVFFAVNTIDVIYLWTRAAVPAGVLARDYLYEGIYSLITATVLAGVVITILFQQSAEVVDSRGLKALAYVWIGQNLVLIAGVFYRLNLFLDVADMTEKRVYVGCFLLLVSLGFGLLCLHVARGRDTGTLIWRNTIATFALFYVLQFANVADWVCRHNFERWQRSSERVGINIGYQLNLGSDAWPALIEFAGSLPPSDSRAALILGLRELARTYGAENEPRNWRETQFRHDRNCRALREWAAPFGELSPEDREAPIIKAFHETRRALR